MAKKTRKQAQRRRPPQRVPGTVSLPGPVPTETDPDPFVPSANDRAKSQPEAEPGGTVAIDAGPQPVSAVATAVPAGRRRVGRVDTTVSRRNRPPRPGSTAASFEPLDSEDAAIPFDRVPYVPADLRRVAVIATVMLIVIVVADIVISRVAS